VTVERALHLTKPQLPSVSTDEGIQIDESDEQPANDDSPMHQSREGLSKITVERDRHSEKQLWQRLSTANGMQSDRSAEHLENTKSLIDETSDPVSKTTLLIVWQPVKQPIPNSLMRFGMRSSTTSPKIALIETHSGSTTKFPKS
jgi:hypothetical protein